MWHFEQIFPGPLHEIPTCILCHLVNYLLNTRKVYKCIEEVSNATVYAVSKWNAGIGAEAEGVRFLVVRTGVTM